MSAGRALDARSARRRSSARSPAASPPAGRTSPRARRRRSARPAPRPSRARGRSASRGCRSSRPCGPVTCSRRGTSRWPGRARGQHPGLRGVRRRGVLVEALGQREELAQAVPAQVVLLDQLLDVLRRRAAGAGLEEAAAVDQRHDRQHLGRGAELEDREQVGVVVAQHVAGDRDGVLALADPLDGDLDRLDRRQDLDGRARRCRAP